MVASPHRGMRRRRRDRGLLSALTVDTRLAACSTRGRAVAFGRSKVVRVGELLTSFLARGGGAPELARGRLSVRVFEAFRAIGPPLTEHVEPTTLKGGMLWVTVGDSAWLTELTFLKATIIERLNQSVGREVVRDIRFRQGKLSKGARVRTSAAPPPALSARQSALVEEWSAAIPDPKVREVVEAAMRRSLADPKKGPAPAGGTPGPRVAPPPPEPPPPPPPRDRWKDRPRPRARPKRKR